MNSKWDASTFCGGCFAPCVSWLTKPVCVGPDDVQVAKNAQDGDLEDQKGKARSAPLEGCCYMDRADVMVVVNAVIQILFVGMYVAGAVLFVMAVSELIDLLADFEEVGLTDDEANTLQIVTDDRGQNNYVGMYAARTVMLVLAVSKPINLLADFEEVGLTDDEANTLQIVTDESVGMYVAGAVLSVMAVSELIDLLADFEEVGLTDDEANTLQIVPDDRDQNLRIYVTRAVMFVLVVSEPIDFEEVGLTGDEANTLQTMTDVVSGVLYAVAGLTVLLSFIFLQTVLNKRCCADSKTCCLVGCMPVTFFMFSIAFGVFAGVVSGAAAAFSTAGSACSFIDKSREAAIELNPELADVPEDTLDAILDNCRSVNTSLSLMSAGVAIIELTLWAAIIGSVLRGCTANNRRQRKSDLELEFTKPPASAASLGQNPSQQPPSVANAMHQPPPAAIQQPPPAAMHQPRVQVNAEAIAAKTRSAASHVKKFVGSVTASAADATAHAPANQPPPQPLMQPQLQQQQQQQQGTYVQQQQQDAYAQQQQQQGVYVQHEQQQSAYAQQPQLQQASAQQPLQLQGTFVPHQQQQPQVIAQPLLPSHGQVVHPVQQNYVQQSALQQPPSMYNTGTQGDTSAPQQLYATQQNAVQDPTAPPAYTPHVEGADVAPMPQQQQGFPSEQKLQGAVAAPAQQQQQPSDQAPMIQINTQRIAAEAKTAASAGGRAVLGGLRSLNKKIKNAR